MFAASCTPHSVLAVILDFDLQKETALTCRKIILEELRHGLRDRALGGRLIVALAGPPPGSWKSTLAESFVESLNADDPGCAAVLPMNGSTTTIFT
jgi:hypothetical protein